MTTLRSRRRFVISAMPSPKREDEAPNWAVRMSSVELRMDTLETELKEHGRRQQHGFEQVEGHLNRLAMKIDTATSKPPPWGLIVSAFVGICTILIGIGGLGMSMAGGLALWANAYFGRNIQIAEGMAKEAQLRIEAVQGRWDDRAEKQDEILHELVGDLRALDARLKAGEEKAP